MNHCNQYAEGENLPQGCNLYHRYTDEIMKISSQKFFSFYLPTYISAPSKAFALGGYDFKLYACIIFTLWEIVYCKYLKRFLGAAGILYFMTTQTSVPLESRLLYTQTCNQQGRQKG
jgi:hypothetical protein